MNAPETARAKTRRCEQAAVTRRFAMKTLAGLGIGGAVFQRALAAKAVAVENITPAMVQEAEWIAGIELSPEERERTARRLTGKLQQFESLRNVDLPEETFPALVFDPQPWEPRRDDGVSRECGMWKKREVSRPESDEELAFLPVWRLAELVRTRKVSSTELTRLYLERLRRYDPVLKCTVTLTEETALRQAKQADKEIAAGRYRGPLHGIPWGAKDLIAYPGYPTTWGAPQYKDRVVDRKATVARLLEEAGAVLVAKLSLGALAQGDRWYGGPTRNPWNPAQGSSGSSAGSASAVAAGLVGFAIGSETLGSIVSPCRRCGCAGLRPTFGRVSRTDCMALSWSMDKLGPIARSIEDCALILSQIHGADGKDAAAVNRPFHWPPTKPLQSLRVGYFEADESASNQRVLDTVRELGVRLVPIELPAEIPPRSLTNILDVEAAAAFDEWTRNGVTEGLNNWPETFRAGKFISAVDYLRANRLRVKLMESMRQTMKDVDVYIEGADLAITNLTGHPTAVVPSFVIEDQGIRRPSVVSFTGNLFDEESLVHLAAAFEAETIGDERPQLDRWLKESRSED